jgi:hypothetical protein
VQKIAEFDGSKRTCVTQLAQHNARRRARAPAHAPGTGDAGAAPPGEPPAAPPPPSASPSSRRTARPSAAARHWEPPADTAGPSSGLAAALHAQRSWDSASLMDADDLLLALGPPELDLHDWLAAAEDDPSALPLGTLPPGAVPLPWPPLPALPPAPPPAPPPPGAAAAAAAAAVAAAALRPSVFHVKLPDATPAQLPCGLPAAFAAAFCLGRGDGGGGEALPLPAATPAAISAALRAGCVLLTLDVLQCTDGEGAADAAGAAEAAQTAVARLLRAPGAVGDFFRAQRAFSVHAPHGGGAAAAAAGAPAPAAAPPPCLPRLPPLAALAALSCGAPVAVACAPSPGDAAAKPQLLHCRLHGAPLPLAPDAAVPHGALALLLPPAGAEGAALLESATDAASAHLAGAPRLLLLCADPGIVAEVATLAYDTHGAAQRDAAEQIVLLLGAALHPAASAPVLSAAAAAAVLLGWPATLARLLPALRAAAARASGGVAAAAAAACCRGGASLLHRAASAGSAELARALIAAGGPEALFGAAHTRSRDGRTPLHSAAVAADGGALAAALLDASAVGPARAADALWAWFRAAAPGDGATPAHLAEASAAAGGASAALLAALCAALRARHAAAAARAAALLAGLEAEGMLLPHLQLLAAAEALADAHDAVSADAAAMFRAAQRALDALDARERAAADGSECADDAAGPSARPPELLPGAPPPAAAADTDAAYTLWLAARGRPLFAALTSLWALKSIANAMHLWHVVLLAPAPAGGALGYAAPRNARHFYGDSLLHDPRSGAHLTVPELPWAAMRAGAAHIVALTLGVRLPCAAAALALCASPAAWAWAAPRYEPIFLAVVVIESCVYLGVDLIMLAASGGLVVEWPARVLVLRALILVASLAAGPFRSRANRASWAVRLLTSSGAVMAAYPALRMRLWHNAGFRLHLLLMGAELLLERANQRRLRRRHAQSVAAEAAAAAAAAAAALAASSKKLA